jgi:hypothetical protein
MVLAVLAIAVSVGSAAKFYLGNSSRGSRPVATKDSAPEANRFDEVAQQSGLDFVHECGAQGNFYIPEEMGAGGAWLDFDNDGDLDAYLVQGGFLAAARETDRNRLFRNNGDGTFADVSAATGADVPGYGMGAYAADIDNDGDVDLYVTRVGSNVLLRNDGGSRFVDVSAESGVDDGGFGTGAVFFDYDGDGFLDLYVANYLLWSPRIELPCYGPSGARDYCNPVDYKSPAEDRLYRNRGNGTFEDVTATAGIAGAWGHGLGVVASDFNGDGKIDLYVANDQNPAFFWVNQGDGTFIDDAAYAGCAFNSDGIAIAGMGVACEDFDLDRDFDLIVTNIHDQAHLALQNSAGTFRDMSRPWGLGGWGVPYTGFGISVFDQDHDGTLEGFVANGAVNIQLETRRPGHPYAEPNQFVTRDERGRFVDASDSAGLPFGDFEMSRGALAGDYDNDGDVDLLVANNRGRAKLLRNNYNGDNNWILLDVRLSTGGRHALNSVVEVNCGEQTWMREVRRHVGYLSSNDPRLHFGVGQAEKVAEITVTMPDGRRFNWRDLPINRLIRLVPGQAPEFENFDQGGNGNGA